MNIFNFIQWSFDEIFCITYLKEQIKQFGVACKYYGDCQYCYEANTQCFKRRYCYCRQFLHYKTNMENFKLLFRYWKIIKILQTDMTKFFFRKELCCQFSYKCYKTIWEKTCKLKKIKYKYDDGYQHIIQMEFDESLLL